LQEIKVKDHCVNIDNIKGLNYNLPRGLITKCQNVSDQIENGYSIPKRRRFNGHCSSSQADQTGRGKATPRPTMRLHHHCNGLVSPFHLPYQRMAFSGFI
jgi:hypothetical protein